MTPHPILAAHGLEPAVTEIGKRADRLIIDIESRERARHDHEEDERDDWSPRSAYFDHEYNREGDPHLNGAFG